MSCTSLANLDFMNKRFVLAIFTISVICGSLYMHTIDFKQLGKLLSTFHESIEVEVSESDSGIIPDYHQHTIVTTSLQRDPWNMKNSKSFGQTLRRYNKKCGYSFLAKHSDVMTEKSWKHSPRPRAPWTPQQLSLLTLEQQHVLDMPFPEQFIEEFVNPCWNFNASNHDARHTCSTSSASSVKQHLKGQLNCLPYYFLAGFPKCATTDLYYKIGLHPQIKIPRIKEGHWWTRKRLSPAFCNTSRHAKGKRPFGKMNHYIRNFKEVSCCLEFLAKQKTSRPIRIITGDSSASTFWDNGCWKLMPGNEELTEPKFLIAHQIQHYLPDAKFIVVMRNPVDRLFSDYRYFLEGRKPTASEFHKNVVADLHQMEMCMRNHTLRYCTYTWSLYQSRFYIGMYSVYVKDWLRVFNKSQLHFLRTEDYKVDPLGELNKIYKFLGLSTFPNASLRYLMNLSPKNEYGTHKHVQMLSKTKELLVDFYRPFNSELAQVLGDDKYLWKSNNESN